MDKDEKQLRARLLEIAATTEVISAAKFVLDGAQYGALDERPSDRRSDRVELPPQIFSLRKRIYHRFYARVRPGESSANSANAPDDTGKSDDPLIRQLSEANQSRRCWDEGWITTHRAANGFVTARKDQRSNSFPPGQFLHDGGPTQPKEGDLIRIHVYRESFTMQTGFYFAFGETLSDQVDGQSVLRVYWNVDPDGAVELVRQVTEVFNRYCVPFRLKCPKRSAAYGRIDTAVLYFAFRHAPIASELIHDMYPTLRSFMSEPTPLFTKRLNPGLAWAQSPPDGQSFGMHRCQIIAEGLRAAWESGGASVDDRLAAIERQFDARGVSLSAPHLNPFNEDVPGYTDWPQFA